MFQFFDYEDARAFAQHEAVAVAVERPSGCLRVIVARRKSTRRAKTTEAHSRYRPFRAARYHDIRVAPLDRPQRVADGIARRGAGGRNGRIGTAQLEVNRDRAAGIVGNHLGNDEGADPARTTLNKAAVLLFKLVESADAAAENDAA